MSEWEKLVAEGQLQIADTSSKKWPVELHLLFEEQIKIWRGFTVRKSDECVHNIYQ